MTFTFAIPDKEAKHAEMYRDNYRKWARMDAETKLAGKPVPGWDRVSVFLEVIYRTDSGPVDTADLAPGIEGLKDAGVLTGDCEIEYPGEITYTQGAGMSPRVEVTIVPTDSQAS